MSLSSQDVPAPPRGTLDRLSDAVGGRLSSVVLGVGSAVRHARVFHPRGRAFHGTLRCHGAPLLAGSVLGADGEHDVIVRFSRGAGLAEPLPDMLGLAMRIVDADGAGNPQDVLMLSSAPTVGARNVIGLRVGYGETFYSTIDRLGVGDRAVMLGARASSPGAPRTLARLSELAAAVAEGDVRVELSVTTPFDAAWRPAATLRLASGVDPDVAEGLRFTPFHRAGRLEPVGVVNALRRRGYDGSQRARS